MLLFGRHTIALATLAVGCGRLGFEPGGTGSAGDGSLGDMSDALGDSTGDSTGDTVTAADPCPTAQMLLADDFTGATISTGPMGTWASTFEQSGVTITQNSGRLVVTFPAGSVTGHAGAFSARVDLTTACALVAAPILPDPATAAYAYITIEEATGANPGRITIAAGAGVVEIRKQLSGGAPQIVTTFPYDPIAHAWWRLRTGATFAWETSRDMVAWIPLHEEPAYFTLTNVHLVIGAGTDVASTNAGTAQFDTARVFTP